MQHGVGVWPLATSRSLRVQAARILLRLWVASHLWYPPCDPYHSRNGNLKIASSTIEDTEYLGAVCPFRGECKSILGEDLVCNLSLAHPLSGDCLPMGGLEIHDVPAEGRGYIPSIGTNPDAPPPPHYFANQLFASRIRSMKGR